MIKKIMVLMLTALSLDVYAIPDCPTHVVCQTNTICVCSTGVSSAYDRFYYGDFELKENQHYRCTLRSLGVGYYVLDRIDAPANMSIQGVQSIPLALSVDTTQLTQKEKLSVRFLVPASDIPDSVEMTCQIEKSSS